MKKTRNIKDAKYLIIIYSQGKGKEIEIAHMFEAKTGKIVKPKTMERISLKHKNIEELKEDLCWNLNKDPEKFVINWGLKGWGEIYLFD